MKQRSTEAVLKPVLFLIVITGTLLVAYLPGLRGPFVFDDKVSIASNPAVAIESLDVANLTNAALSNESGPLKRPLAFVSFALNHYFADGMTDTLPFKITNLAIHIINTGLVYWLSLLLLRQLAERVNFRRNGLYDWLPGLIAGAWALHPLQVTSVLYVVQRMTSLSALFVLGGIIIFIHGRIRVQEDRPRGYTLMTLGLVGGLTLGLTSKENAALLPLFVLIIEYVFFRGAYRDPYGRRRLRWFYGIAIFAPCLLVALWLLSRPDFILNTYTFREFSLGERLLTEPRVLWFYSSLIFYPSIQRLGLFHDDISISTSLFEPWTTSLALVALFAIIIVGVFLGKKYPMLSFSVLWFLAGHAMESTFIGLEIAHEHRNYLPTVGPFFGITYGFARLLERFQTATVPGVAFVILLVTLAVTTSMRARVWMSEDSIATHLIEYHPRSARTHLMLAELYARKGNPIGAIEHYKRSAELAPHETGYLLRLVLTVARTTVNTVDTVAQSSKAGAESNSPMLFAFINVRRSNEGIRLELSRSIMDEISDNIRHYPIDSRTAQGLAELTECVIVNTDRCGHLYSDLVAWYELAISNPRTFSGTRNDMIINLAKTYMTHGDYERALGTAHKARLIEPLNPNFILMEANAYFHLDQLDKSEQNLMFLNTRSIAITSHIRAQAEILSTMIEARRDQTIEK